MSQIEERLRKLGLRLPEAAAPAGNYVPWSRTGNLVFVSGQIPPLDEDKDGVCPFKGRVGANVTPEIAYRAARYAALTILAQLRAACDGDLDRARACVKLGGFVACTPDFEAHPKVVNGASDLLVEAMGEAGRHARFAVGVQSLPLGVCVEVEGTFEVD